MSNSKTDAERFYAQGNYTQALLCYRQLPKNDDIDQCIRLCLLKMARKFWRQGKVEEFKKIMDQLPKNAESDLALAALCGKEALAKFAQSEHSSLSQLALCRVQSDLKTALLHFRQIPELKSIGEGWIALLKGDPQRAIDLFAESALTAPIYAKVGEGIALLVQGKKIEAEKKIETLRPYAPSRFPVLAKVMGWTSGENVAIEAQIPTDLLHASLSRLVDVDKKTPASHKLRKGWLALRIGDQHVHQSVTAAQRYWRAAEKLHPPLRLNVLKRQFHVACQSHYQEEIAGEFFALLRRLLHERPDDVDSFLEHIAFEVVKTGEVFFHPAEMRSLKKGWAINPPPVAFQLLWCSLMHEYRIEDISQVLLLPSLISEKQIFMDGEQWEQFFLALDPKYQKREPYLQMKLTIQKVFDKPLPIRNTIAQLLAVNPHLVEKLLPLYVRKTMELTKTDISFSEKETLFKTIESLHKVFPSNFDLFRLAYLLNPDAQKKEVLLSSCFIQFGEPLGAVFELQCLLDSGCSLATAKKKLLPPKLYGQSQEADRRYIAALCETTLSFSKGFLKKAIGAIAPDSERKHELFRFLWQYRLTPPCSVLEDWCRSDEQNWRPFYNLSLFYAKNNQREECLEMLEDARYRIGAAVPELSVIEKTLEFYDEYENASDDPHQGDLFERLLKELEVVL